MSKEIFSLLILTLTVSLVVPDESCDGYKCKKFGGIEKCINSTSLCDGIIDCPNDQNGEDEAKERCQERKNSFECKRSRDRIPSQFKCDGVEDCGYGDQSDENCPVESAPQTENFYREAEPKNKTYPVRLCPQESFQCNLGTKCLLLDQVCDGYVDCPDNSDEIGCVDSCQKGDCSHECRKYPNGPKCLCSEGFMPKAVSNTTSQCFYANEKTHCRSNSCPSADLNCVDLRAGFACKCRPGFTFTYQDAASGSYCKADNVTFNGYIIGNGNGLYRISRVVVEYMSQSYEEINENWSIEPLSVDLDNHVAATYYDPWSKCFYFILLDDDQIYYLNLSITYKVPPKSFSTGFKNMTSLSVDSLDRNVYISTGKKLSICGLDEGRNCQCFYKARDSEVILTGKLNKEQRFYVAVIRHDFDQKKDETISSRYGLLLFELNGVLVDRKYLKGPNEEYWHPTVTVDPFSKTVSIYPYRGAGKIIVVNYDENSPNYNGNEQSFPFDWDNKNIVGIGQNPKFNSYDLPFLMKTKIQYVSHYYLKIPTRSAGMRHFENETSKDFDRTEFKADWYEDEKDRTKWHFNVLFEYSSTAHHEPCDASGCKSGLCVGKNVCIEGDTAGGNDRKLTAMEKAIDDSESKSVPGQSLQIKKRQTDRIEERKVKNSLERSTSTEKGQTEEPEIEPDLYEIETDSKADYNETEEKAYDLKDILLIIVLVVLLSILVLAILALTIFAVKEHYEKIRLERAMIHIQTNTCNLSDD